MNEYVKILYNNQGNKGSPNEEVDWIMQEILPETLFNELYLAYLNAGILKSLCFVTL
jgi:hypothetical protein